MLFGGKNIQDDEEILKRFEEIRRGVSSPQVSASVSEQKMSLSEPEMFSSEPEASIPEETMVASQQVIPEQEKILTEEQKLKEYQDAELSNLRNVGLFQAADKIARSMAAGYGGQVEKADTGVLEEMAKAPLKNYLETLKKYKESQASAKGYQQSEYMTDTGDPVTFDPNSNKYVNALTGESVPSGRIIRNYTRTIVDPKTGEIKEIRPGQGVVGTISGAPSSEPAPKTDEKDYTYEMLNPKQREYLAEVEKEYATDIKDSREFGEILANVEDLINSDISAAIPAIQRQLARSVGREVGVMTDRDVSAFTGDRSLIAALQRFAKMQIEGKMTQRDKEQYRGIIDIVRKNLSKSMENRAGFHAAKIKQRLPDATQQSLMNLLSVDAAKPIGVQSQPVPQGKVKVQLPNGQSGFIDKDKVDAFKQKYPDAKVMQ